MGAWSLTTDPDRVQAIIALAARGLPRDRFLPACRAIQRATPFWLAANGSLLGLRRSLSWLF